MWSEIVQLGNTGEPGLEPSLSVSRLRGSSLPYHPDTAQAKAATLSQTMTKLQEVRGFKSVTFLAALGVVCQKFAGDFRIKLHTLDPGGCMESRPDMSLSVVEDTRLTVGKAGLTDQQ